MKSIITAGDEPALLIRVGPDEHLGFHSTYIGLRFGGCCGTVIRYVCNSESIFNKLRCRFF